MLWDGLGDTLRVSLTEDPLPKFLWPVIWPNGQNIGGSNKPLQIRAKEQINPYEFVRRTTPEIKVKRSGLAIGALMSPVLARASHPLDQPAEIIQEVARVQSAAKDAKVEGLVIQLENDSQLPHLPPYALRF